MRKFILVKIKKILFIVIVCVQMNTSAQNFEKIKNSDTIYVYFKNDNVNQMKGNNNRVNEDNYNYYFYFSVEYTEIRQYYMLINNYRISPEVRWKKKTFLNEKKDLIVNYEFLEKLGFFKSEQLLLKKKKIYIIDRDNFCKSKIKLVEALITERNLAPIE